MRPSTMRPRRGVSSSSATGRAASGTTSTVTVLQPRAASVIAIPRRCAAGERERERHDAAGEGLAGGQRPQLDPGEIAERVDERRGR